MAKFQCKELAGKTSMFAWVGAVDIDADGFFEVNHEQLEDELKHCKGFTFIPEEKKPEPKPEPKVEAKPESKPEPKPAPKATPKKVAAKVEDSK